MVRLSFNAHVTLYSEYGARPSAEVTQSPVWVETPNIPTNFFLAKGHITEGLSMTTQKPSARHREHNPSHAVRSVLCDKLGTFFASRNAALSYWVGFIIATFLEYPFRVLNTVGF